jgi:hypothetical protein
MEAGHDDVYHSIALALKACGYNNVKAIGKMRPSGIDKLMYMKVNKNGEKEWSCLPIPHKKYLQWFVQWFNDVAKPKLYANRPTLQQYLLLSGADLMPTESLYSINYTCHSTTQQVPSQ